jgi:O-antigen chain-terminating methyltransferase
VTAFHLVEHLSTERMLALLDETARVLQAGGVLILETPNPGNLMVASCDFYLDPTHRHPLPIALLRFLVEARGFGESEVLLLHPRSNGSGDSEPPEPFAQYFSSAQDYAIVARRP